MDSKFGCPSLKHTSTKRGDANYRKICDDSNSNTPAGVWHETHGTGFESLAFPGIQISSQSDLLNASDAHLGATPGLSEPFILMQASHLEFPLDRRQWLALAAGSLLIGSRSQAAEPSTISSGRFAFEDRHGKTREINGKVLVEAQDAGSRWPDLAGCPR
jgi:hypothetical protein